MNIVRDVLGFWIGISCGLVLGCCLAVSALNAPFDDEGDDE